MSDETAKSIARFSHETTLAYFSEHFGYAYSSSFTLKGSKKTCTTSSRRNEEKAKLGTYQPLKSQI